MNMKNCINCNKNMTNRNKYCSIHCQKEFEYKKYIIDWKKGIKDGLRGDYQISQHIRKYLMEKYNCKCSLCGWSKINVYTNNIPLEIDHIDGNYQNNKENNLRLLCPNCHSLTDTYKGANLDYGRKMRKKYYEKL